MDKISFSDWLYEAPLPDDWDDALFNERVPFAKRVRYAQERAKRAGSGSSRIAFVIPYEGRQTVLKVAKNAKGMAQNEVEASTLSDWYLQKLGLVIPIIDYDEANSKPTWIHTEFATKAKESDFRKVTGAKSLRELIAYAEQQSGRSRHQTNYDYSHIDEESDLVQALVDFVGNYTHMPTGDLTRLANWGIYDNRPVIIDVGLDNEVMSNHYTPKKPANFW